MEIFVQQSHRAIQTARECRSKMSPLEGPQGTFHRIEHRMM
ncbi:hypothetical protein [Verminephrobacter aporrectodeae]|nr:hypothetical protein [Verminephrobacter aporrectodeae]